MSVEASSKLLRSHSGLEVPELVEKIRRDINAGCRWGWRCTENSDARAKMGESKCCTHKEVRLCRARVKG